LRWSIFVPLDLCRAFLLPPNGCNDPLNPGSFATCHTILYVPLFSLLLHSYKGSLSSPPPPILPFFYVPSARKCGPHAYFFLTFTVSAHLQQSVFSEFFASPFAICEIACYRSLMARTRVFLSPPTSRAERVRRFFFILFPLEIITEPVTFHISWCHFHSVSFMKVEVRRVALNARTAGLETLPPTSENDDLLSPLPFKRAFPSPRPPLPSFP